MPVTLDQTLVVRSSTHMSASGLISSGPPKRKVAPEKTTICGPTSLKRTEDECPARAGGAVFAYGSTVHVSLPARHVHVVATAVLLPNKEVVPLAGVAPPNTKTVPLNDTADGETMGSGKAGPGVQLQHGLTTNIQVSCNPVHNMNKSMDAH